MKTVRFIIAFVLLAVLPTIAVAKPPQWDKKYEGTKRWKASSEFSLPYNAFIDKETGLVWIGSASLLHYQQAYINCAYRINGERGGWRMPTIEELMTLFSGISIDGLQPGIPWGIDTSYPFMSNTTDPADSTKVLAYNPTPPGTIVRFDKDGAGADPVGYTYCVRGGIGNDGQ